MQHGAHQLTNETKQTGFRAGFFPGLIGINCERLQSTTRSLTLTSSERFLLIVLMITTGAGDHHRAGNGPALIRARDGAPASLFLPPAVYQGPEWGTGTPAQGLAAAPASCQFMKLIVKPPGPGEGAAEQVWPGSEAAGSPHLYNRGREDPHEHWLLLPYCVTLAKSLPNCGPDLPTCNVRGRDVVSCKSLRPGSSPSSGFSAAA